MVRPIVNRFPNATEVANQVARDLFDFVRQSLEVQERVDVALTGGTVGIASLAAASEQPFNELDLARLHIWWGDERFVASDHDDRNAVQARRAFLGKLNIPSENIHEFPSSDLVDLETAAVNFNSVFEASKVNFDLMLMGMGPDGHVASLFPGHSVGASEACVVAEPNSPKPPPQRLSFTYRTINASKQIWFTVAGSDKSEAVSTVFGDAPESLPAGRVHGTEKTVWYLDQTAGNLVFGC